MALASLVIPPYHVLPEPSFCSDSTVAGQQTGDSTDFWMKTLAFCLYTHLESFLGALWEERMWKLIREQWIAYHLKLKEVDDLLRSSKFDFWFTWIFFISWVQFSRSVVSYFLQPLSYKARKDILEFLPKLFPYALIFVSFTWHKKFRFTSLPWKFLLF